MSLASALKQIADALEQGKISPETATDLLLPGLNAISDARLASSLPNSLPLPHNSAGTQDRKP